MVGSCLLFLFLGLDLEDRASFIIPAFGADPMRRVRQAVIHSQRTMRVRSSVQRPHHVMRASLARAGIGMTAFRIRHRFPLNLRHFERSEKSPQGDLSALRASR